MALPEVVVVVAAVLTAAAWAVGELVRRRAATCRCTSSMQGKVVVITGASAGIGRHTALALAQRGATVVLACRNLAKAARVAEEIMCETQTNCVKVLQLDTSSLASVRSFADTFVRQYKRLDVLVLNAGAGGFLRHQLTEDNLEYTLATNHLGHFLLAHLLLGNVLRREDSSRVVVVASQTHTRVRDLNTEALNGAPQTYTPMSAYRRSKLCNVLFASQLARILKDTGVTVNSLCPGFVQTEIFRKSESFLTQKVYGTLVWPLGKTCEQGAQTVIHLAVAPKLASVTGKHFVNCKVVEPSCLASNEDLAKDLWEASETLVSLRPQERLLRG
ncbi:retinol dehydrogenase 13-like [Oratosquilla oratoria]|uniref:retinol dehydrogenase 13-like n=1 Tax=Oratosquilla oratoria TaxID=337810 RepID=UPI003F771F03